MDQHLHIVCLDVPFPADYGGVVDLFYKIKNLHSMHVKIHLHCFEYGRGRQVELEKYCEEIFYYRRKTGLSALSFSIPYIVNSRKNKELISRIMKDNYPVLLEGIHCTYPLFKDQLPGKKVFVRLHNVEFRYYQVLANTSTSIFKKLHYRIESSLLKKYEKSIFNKAKYLSVSVKDMNEYKDSGCINITFLPVFIPFENIRLPGCKGNFCIYHGKLSVPENIKAVYWLVNIFRKLNIPLVIAGMNPSKELIEFAESTENICVIANPGIHEMNDLIAKAQVNVLPSFNSTGIKIKLLNALFLGKHCIVNANTIEDTHLAKLCHIAVSDEHFIQQITELLIKDFTEEDSKQREEILSKIYNNKLNTLKLIQEIY